MGASPVIRRNRSENAERESPTRPASSSTVHARSYGSTLVVVDRFFPSSKLCSDCGVLKDALTLGQRRFDCDACGLVLDRDENAAINLRRAGLGGLPEGHREVTPVERKALAPEMPDGAKPASPKQEATGRRTRGGTRRLTGQLVEVPA